MLVASHPLKPHRVPKLLPGTVQHSKMNQTHVQGRPHMQTHLVGIDQHWQTQWPQSKNSVNRLITESFLAAGSPCCWKDFCRSKVKINLSYLPDGWNMVQQADCSDQLRAEQRGRKELQGETLQSVFHVPGDLSVCVVMCC